MMLIISSDERLTSEMFCAGSTQRVGSVDHFYHPDFVYSDSTTNQDSCKSCQLYRLVDKSKDDIIINYTVGVSTAKTHY